MNLESTCEEVRELVREVGEAILDFRNQFNRISVEDKGLHNYVTQADKNAEISLVNGLKKLLPEAGFIAEEGTSNKVGERYQWIIDPIDGTTNFIHGIPTFAISVALLDGDELVLGVVYEINANEMFYAWKDAPAYLNGEPIAVSAQNEMHRTLVATGFPYSDYEFIDNYMWLLKHFMQSTSGLRRIGSAAVDLVYVACGRFECFFEYGLNPWDVAGGALIVKQAGGMVSDWKGGKDYIFGEEILATNMLLHDSFLQQIETHFKQ